MKSAANDLTMTQTRTCLTVFLVCLALMAGSCRDPMEHAHCDDTVVKRILSPDRKLVIVIYNRTCNRGVTFFSYADVEDATVWFSWPRHPVVCFLVSHANSPHQLDAVWRDGNHIDVSSPDELDKYDVDLPEHTCKDIDIEVVYNFKFKPPPVQEAPDKETVAAIREAIIRSEDCIDEKFGAGHSKYLRSLLDDEQHRQALELLCTNLEVGKCPVSRATYALLTQAGTKMGIAGSYLDNLKPLVR
jgi:hypothetical protein